MLQQFLPLYEHSTHSVSSKRPTALKTTVIAPLLYRIQKDGREHYILGHIHPIPLTYMPEEVLDIISGCSCLLTESMATLPQTLESALIQSSPFYGSFTGFFSNNLTEEVKKRFKRDISEILQTLTSVTQPIDIENISVNLLSTLFTMFIQSRIEPDKLRIDEALIQLFKHQKKPIIELNEAIKKDYSEFCMENEKFLQNQLRLNASRDEQMKGTSFLQGFAKVISEYYQNLDKREATPNSCIKDFLEKDLTCEPVVCAEEELFQAQQENEIWCDIFVKEHNKGTNNICLPCGYKHLLISEGNLLQLLSNKGFTVERVCREENEIINQFKSFKI